MVGMREKHDISDILRDLWVVSSPEEMCNLEQPWIRNPSQNTFAVCIVNFVLERLTDSDLSSLPRRFPPSGVYPGGGPSDRRVIHRL